MRVTLVSSEAIVENIWTFWFMPQRPLRYTAGQFIEMYLPHDNPDDRGQKHWFTVSSSPTEKLISITTKHAGNRISTFKQTLFDLKAGAQVAITEPMGDFVLPKDKTLPLVFVAGGIGITPMRSMIKWLIDTGEKRSIHLVYAAKTADELVYKDLFQSYNAQLDIIITNKTNHLSANLILKLSGHDPRQLIYVSGPEPMVETLEKDLLTAGVNKQKLVLDLFPNYDPI